MHGMISAGVRTPERKGKAKEAFEKSMKIIKTRKQRTP